MASFSVKKMVLYFYGIHTVREQLVITNFNFLLVRLADISFSWDAFLDPGTCEWCSTEITLVPMDIMAGADAIWRI